VTNKSMSSPMFLFSVEYFNHCIVSAVSGVFIRIEGYTAFDGIRNMRNGWK